jgi:hypothetical protein
VKVLFVGEGNTDIGRVDFAPNQPRPAGGVVATLARRVCPAISDSLAIRWTEITRLSRTKARGFAGKVAAALLLSQVYECCGTICVVDCDGNPDRLDELHEGRDRGFAALSAAHKVACGVAIESIEAWTLGDCRAIAEELGVTESDVSALLPRGKGVEELKESSEREDYRPKALLKRIASLDRREDSTEFRKAVAGRADVARLGQTCPRGFKPFAEEVRREFGTAEVMPGETHA